MLRLSILLLLALICVAERPQAQSRTLDIYWVDVEGGAATLFVAPSGESMLIDTGFGRRRSRRRAHRRGGQSRRAAAHRSRGDQPLPHRPRRRPGRAGEADPTGPYLQPRRQDRAREPEMARRGTRHGRRSEDDREAGRPRAAVGRRGADRRLGRGADRAAAARRRTRMRSAPPRRRRRRPGSRTSGWWARTCVTATSPSWR